MERAASQPSPPGPEWLDALRVDGQAAFDRLGYPTKRHEAWRYTSTRTLAAYDPAPPVGPDDHLLHMASEQLASMDFLGGPRVVLLHGRLAPSLGGGAALPDGVRVESLPAAAGGQLATELRENVGQVARSEDGAFVALNAAHSEAVVVQIDPGVVSEVPLEVIHLTVSTEARTIQPRLFVSAGQASQFTLVERYVGPAEGAAWTNGVTELLLGQDGILRHVKVIEEEGEAHHVGSIAARVGRGATLRSHGFSLGARLGRTDLHVMLAEPGASCELDGLYVATDAQHLDHYTVVDHQASQTTSNTLYKGIVDDEALGGFVGRVMIREGATQSESHQLNHNLLLSRKATAHTRPQLEIDNDDVVATHGSTVGQLDRDGVFYLRTRGIDGPTAEAIMTWAFAQELVQRVPLEALRDHLRALCARRLARAAGPEVLAALRETL